MLRKKIIITTGEVCKKEEENMQCKWDYEAQIVEYSILKYMATLTSDEILAGIKVFIEPDAMFLNIRIEKASGLVWHERHNNPDEAEMGANAMKAYFEESGYVVEKSDYGYCAILKP